MAIDFLILALLLVSFLTNLLALIAFWITPGLRTTANRFTINLLIINLIGCLILAPTLFLSSPAFGQFDGSNDLNANLSASSVFEGSGAASENTDDSIELYTKPGNEQLIIRHNGLLVEKEGIILTHNLSKSSDVDADEKIAATTDDRTIETVYKCNSTICKELRIDEGSDTIVITELQETVQENSENVAATHELPLIPPSTIYMNMRWWSLDMAAALGALAVLLVVGDTWCAVTDPLRYHSRISGVKAWIFIALTWILGILFGALSAFRTLDFEAERFFSKKRQRIMYSEAYYSLYTSNGIFDMVFACLYFIVVILLPFGFVCGMYWRIFSEARENGLRMRQNGSSPLLQSALNLTHHQSQPQQTQSQQCIANTSASTGTIVGPLHYTNSLCLHRNSISSTSSQSAMFGTGGSGGGLHMQIDQRRSQQQPSPAFNRRDSAAKVLLPTISDDATSIDIEDSVDFMPDEQFIVGRHFMPVPEAGEEVSPVEEQQQTVGLSDRNQNILLTIQAASGEIKRNYSARHLELLNMSSQDLQKAERLQGMRQVHSSPNLHKYSDIHQDPLSSDEQASAHLLGYNPVQTMQLHRHHFQTQFQAHQQPQQLQQHRLHYQSPPLGQQQHQRYQGHGRRHSHALQIPAMQGSPKALSYMSSLRHRLSNASSLFKYREESRAARISILVVFMFLVSYLPYGFLVLLQSRLPSANFPHSAQLAIVMILLGYLTSPFIFAYRNKRVRRGVKRLFGLDRHSRSEHLLQSQGSLGGGSGSVIRQRANIHRNSSKVSTYSLNSCKHITPQASILSNDGNNSTSLVAQPSRGTVGTLRPNSSCSTIINFMLTKNSSNNNSAEEKEGCQTQSTPKISSEHITQAPKQATSMPIVGIMKPNTMQSAEAQKRQFSTEQLPLATTTTTITPSSNYNNNNNSNNKLTAAKRRNIFRLFFHSSQQLNLGLKACAQGVVGNGKEKPVEV